MPWLERQRAIHVFYRQAVVTDHEIDRGTLVPGLCKIWCFLDQAGKDTDGLFKLACIHGARAHTHELPVLGIVMMIPSRPDQAFSGSQFQMFIARLQDVEQIVEPRIGLVRNDRRRTEQTGQQEKTERIVA